MNTQHSCVTSTISPPKEGERFTFLVKLKQLHATHKQLRAELVANTEFFVLAHEWYEILVTVDEVDELSRLEFIRTLSEEEHTEPTEPGDSSYPNPTIVHRSYERNVVIVMMKYQLVKLDALLEEEQESCETAEAEVRRNTAVEDETMRQMREACFDLHDGVRRQNEEIEECMQKMKGFSDAIMKQCTKNAEGSKYIINELKKVSERSKEATLKSQDMQKKQTKELQDWKEERKEHSRSSSPRTGCKRRHGGFEIPPSELQRYERILDQSEKELTEIDDFLSRNVVKDRRFGSRNMKEGEGGMTCVYCKVRGNHYSDACAEVRSVSRRIELLKSENRCMVCLEFHFAPKCPRNTPCFYCKSGNYRDDLDHHCSICRRPEEFADKMRRREEIKVLIDICERALESSKPCSSRWSGSRRGRPEHDREPSRRSQADKRTVDEEW
ncbi:hypothetical protein COOONC_27167 [Cooperia oncophora]